MLADDNADADADPTEGGDNRLYPSNNRASNVQALHTYADSTTSLAERYEYNPYGERLIYDANDTLLSSSAYGNPQGYGGTAHDEETTKIPVGAHHRDPVIGHWLSRGSLGLPGGATGTNTPGAPRCAARHRWLPGPRRSSWWPWSDSDPCQEAYETALATCRNDPANAQARCRSRAQCNLFQCSGTTPPASCTPVPEVPRDCGPLVLLYTGSLCNSEDAYYAALRGFNDGTSCVVDCMADVTCSAAGVAAGAVGIGEGVSMWSWFYSTIPRTPQYRGLSSMITRLSEMLSNYRALGQSGTWWARQLRAERDALAALRALFRRLGVPLPANVAAVIRAGVGGAVVGIVWAEAGIAWYCAGRCQGVW